MAGILFEDIFDVKDIDPDGKKFDRGVLNEKYTISQQWNAFFFLIVSHLIVRMITGNNGKKSGVILQLLHNLTFNIYGEYSAKPKVFPF